jgi:glucose/arabinose dehydrogenase
LTHAADDRLFITEQDGRIQVVIDGEIAPEPFLDITDRVGFNANEQGLLGLAFHPDYEENGFFFVDYTDGNGNTIVSRFQVSGDPNRADPSSEQLVLAVQQPFRNHNGGQILFGPDGYLYVGLGDGGSGGDPQGNGQNPVTLLGSILRLDVDTVSLESPYAIPADNPFAGGEGAPEVWAYGLRNPWRFSFDPLNGAWYIADVGQNQYEEVNALSAAEAAGANYGWNIMEGLNCYGGANCDQSGLVLPVVEYSHDQGGCSVTGGYVYRGAQYDALDGHYFFGDYCSGFIWSLYQNEEGQWVTGQGALVTVDGQITSFGADAQGEIYVVTREGVIYHLQP